jgi:hypothetical protein
MSLQSILSYHPIDRIRRNHGLEHATIHVLTSRKRRSLAGYSNTGGFWLMGDVSTSEVESAANEALHRMKHGEPDLAIHPGCGTNYVTMGIFGAVAAFAAFLGARTFRDKIERLPMAMAFIMGALIVAQPVGMKLQAQVTTNGHVGTLEVAEVRRINSNMHRVETRG